MIGGIIVRMVLYVTLPFPHRFVEFARGSVLLRLARTSTYALHGRDHNARWRGLAGDGEQCRPVCRRSMPEYVIYLISFFDRQLRRRSVGFGLQIEVNAAPLLVLELAYPTQVDTLSSLPTHCG